MDSRQKQLQPILQTLMLVGAVIEDISITQATLEDVFVKVTGIGLDQLKQEKGGGGKGGGKG